MDDLEAVRKALGYGKLDLYGISYGATAAQVFLRRHPGSVRTVVLDGATLLDVPFMSRFASNGQRALDLIAARCAAQSSCARAFPTWRADLLPLLARLQAAPVTVQVAGSPIGRGRPHARGHDPGMTKTDNAAASVPLLVSRAAAGDYSVLAANLTPPAPPDLSIMPWSILCNEPWCGLDPVASPRTQGHVPRALRRSFARQRPGRLCRLPEAGRAGRRVGPGQLESAGARTRRRRRPPGSDRQHRRAPGRDAERADRRRTRDGPRRRRVRLPPAPRRAPRRARLGEEARPLVRAEDRAEAVPSSARRGGSRARRAGRSPGSTCGRRRPTARRGAPPSS